ncbi:MAG TPA: tRNA pseudouridine(54/55) synthase Pus10 [Nitrosopumilaceae archaeon]|nr:tRNA pseudouridine(54/55) synthase Pus10 [Nitrosopumilaceae archaeon]
MQTKLLATPTNLKQKIRLEKKLAQILSIVEKILDEYPLCTACTGRLLAKKLGLLSYEQLGKRIYSSLQKSEPNKCFVCKNFLLNINHFVDKLLEISSEYEFSTFLVGAILKPSIIDNDDEIRSKFRLRGIDSVKTDFTNQIAKIFSKKTKSQIDYLNPEITLTIDLKTDSYQVKSKPLFLFGKYTKTERGIPQKEKPCSNCEGKGCRTCNNHGMCTFDSVEGKIAKLVFDKFGADQIKVTWIGGEDKTSLVLNKGRPFFVKVINPKKRSIKLAKKITQDKVVIHNLHLIKQNPKTSFPFKTKIQLHVKTEDSITKDDLKPLESLIKNTIAVYDKNKRNEKLIYSVKYDILSTTSFSLSITADGGLPIKRFVEGIDVFPNLTDLLNTKCICKEFDFHEVKLV